MDDAAVGEAATDRKAALDAETEDEADSQATDDDEVAEGAGRPTKRARDSTASEPAAAPSSASGTPSAGRWEVTLGSTWRAYDAAVQAQLEAAWERDEDEMEVVLRGQAYIVRLRGKMVQEVKADPQRWRAVRRVGDIM